MYSLKVLILVSTFFISANFNILDGEAGVFVWFFFANFLSTQGDSLCCLLELSIVLKNVNTFHYFFYLN